MNKDKASRLILWAFVNRIGDRWHILKTQLYYRHAFGHFGKNSVIRSPLMLHNTQFMSIADNVSIRQGARFDLVSERFGRAYEPRVVIEEGVSIEQNFHLACAEEIVISRKVAITENVGIFDIWHPYTDIELPIVDQPLKTAPVFIGEETLIGMGVVIQPGVTIGKHCVIGANSVVTRDIPDYAVAVGIPARVIKYYNFQSKQWTKTK